MPVESWVWLTVTVLRILLPFSITRWPLAGAIVCIIADTHDHTIFRSFGFGPPGGENYQQWDKLLDTWNLTMLMAVSRSWTQALARRTALWLYVWRVAGVVFLSLTHWRPVLVLTPNIFEYFWLFWVISLKWFPFRLTGRRLAFILVAIGIPKLYQEASMHWLAPDQPLRAPLQKFLEKM